MEIVLVNGMPRSGTSWLGQIFDSCPNTRFKLEPLFSYRFKDRVNTSSTKEDWDVFLNEVYNTKDEFMDQTKRKKDNKYPIFQIKENEPKFLVMKYTRYHNLTNRMLELFSDIKIIHIVRNPCGMINSWINSEGEFPKDKNPLDEWRSGKCRKSSIEEFWGFDDWVVLTRMYLNLQNKNPNNVMVVSYDELVDHPIKGIKKMFDFVGMDYTQQTIRFIQDFHKTHISDEYSVFKSKNVKDKWKQTLDNEIIEEIVSEINNTELKRFLI
jgi:hypothetical protein